MKFLIHSVLFLTFFVFTANLVQKMVWPEETETVAQNDDQEDDSDDSDEDNETEKKETEWFTEAFIVEAINQESFEESRTIQFPEVTNKLPDTFTSILISPPESMC